MSYLVFASVTYSSQANRDSALSSINSSLASYSVTPQATAYTGGVNTSGTTALTISIIVANADAASVLSSILTYLTSNRATTGQTHGMVKIT